MAHNHLAPHARNKITADNIFKVGGMAKDAKDRLGASKVIDGSLGTLLEDNGEMALIQAVEQATGRLKPQQIAPYAPIGGLPEYREDVLTYLFGHIDRPQPMGAVATAGATGAVFLCAWNFLSIGDVMITHDYFWSPYAAIARNAVRKLALFETFLPDGGFNVAGALNEVERALKLQNRALLIINTPCHNPTGLCLTYAEAKALKQGLIDLCERYPDAPLTLLVDAAYWEFEDAEFNREFVSLFQGLPSNMVFAIAYSISKSMTRYGFRTGAFVVSASEQSVIDELVGTFISSVRATWSNTPRIGQAVFSTIFRDPELKQMLSQEQVRLAHLCNSRGQTFLKEAQQVGLRTTPYKKGFFTVIPTDRSGPITDALFKENIYLVPMGKGVRVAFCAMASHQIPGLAARLKPHFDVS